MIVTLRVRTLAGVVTPLAPQPELATPNFKLRTAETGHFLHAFEVRTSKFEVQAAFFSLLVPWREVMG
jgi:hypothetical protein